MTETEWVDYQVCPRDARHVLLGNVCRHCDQPAPASRALTSVGKFHWLCWQQQLDWADRFRPDHALDLTALDFVAWAETDPGAHSQYVGFLSRSAIFAPTDITRATRGYLLFPGQPPTTVILELDGTVTRPDHPGPGRWGVDPAGVLVLNIDRTQYRVIGDRAGLHTGRRVPHGSTVGAPMLLVLWSDAVTGAGVRVTSRSATALTRRHQSEFIERDLFTGVGPQVSIFGPEQRATMEADTGRRQLIYRRGPDRIGLEGGPVYRGAGPYADWRLTFLKPLA